MNAVGDHSLSLKKIFDNFSDYQGNCLEWSLNGLWFVILGPVVRRPISANPGLDFNLGFFIPLL